MEENNRWRIFNFYLVTFRHQTTLPQKNDRNVNKFFGALLKNIQTFSCISLERSPFPRKNWSNLHCYVSKDKVSGGKFYKSPLQIFGFREIIAKETRLVAKIRLVVMQA